MELLQLKYFKAVAEIGKISAAAESLFISAPALSTSISRLEKELGINLFDRTNNRIQLNEQGQIFLRYVNQVFTTLDYAKVELQQSIIQQKHHISIAATTSNLWTDLVAAFSLEYPQFTLASTNLKFSPLETEGLPPNYTFLLGEENDLPASYAADMDSVILFEDQPVIMVHPSHPLAKAPSVDLLRLQRETLFYPSPDVTMYTRICHLFEERDIQMPYGYTLPYLSYRHMAEEGMGISFTTRHIGSLEPENPNICYVPIANTRPWIMRLYWRKAKPLTNDEQLFISFIRKFYNHLA